MLSKQLFPILTKRGVLTLYCTMCGSKLTKGVGRRRRGTEKAGGGNERKRERESGGKGGR